MTVPGSTASRLRRRGTPLRTGVRGSETGGAAFLKSGMKSRAVRAGVLLAVVFLSGMASCGRGTSPARQSEWKLLRREQFLRLDTTWWQVATHTFDGNAAYFRPENVFVRDGLLHLLLRKSPWLDREYTGGELRTRRSFRYGRFVVRMKAARGSGVVSSFFLYRYDPWQEVDIEFLGKNTRQIHLNTFFNPGPEGAHNNAGDLSHQKPVVLDLPFDAAGAFHDYAVEWRESAIRWYVDGELIYTNADSTRVPNLPMQLMMNLWISRSTGWVGPVDDSALPAEAVYDEVQIYGSR